MIEATIQIAEMAEIYKREISPRAYDVLSRITDLKPGMSGESIRKIIESMEFLISGGMVVLSGKIGCGKTIAATVGALLFQYHFNPGSQNHRRARFKIIPSRWILDAAFSDNKDKYAQMNGCLVIDDLGREHFTDKGFGIAAWDYLFDQRYAWMRPTIITANLTPEEFIRKYNPRILDRLKESAKWIQISENSLRRADHESGTSTL